MSSLIMAVHFLVAKNIKIFLRGSLKFGASPKNAPYTFFLAYEKKGFKVEKRHSKIKPTTN